MKTAFWQASLTASQAGEKSQTNGLEYTIESSILTDLIRKRSTGSSRIYLHNRDYVAGDQWAHPSH
jgi:hypothetical protein